MTSYSRGPYTSLSSAGAVLVLDGKRNAHCLSLAATGAALGLSNSLIQALSAAPPATDAGARHKGKDKANGLAFLKSLHPLSRLRAGVGASPARIVASRTWQAIALKFGVGLSLTTASRALGKVAIIR